MRGFPFEACPTAIDLVRYAAHGSDPGMSEQLAFVNRHLQSCRDCTRAIERFAMGGAHSTGDAFVGWAEWPPFPHSNELDRHIAAQRELLDRVMSSTGDDPRPGDVWVSTYRHGTEFTRESGVPWLLLVLDSYQRDYTANWVVDAVPVTEDWRVAADWSLVISEEHNDFSMMIVAHLDFQFTTNRESLQRRLGRLSELCFECVRLVLRAFDLGEAAPQCLSCGTLGSASIRSRSDWLVLDAKLRRLIDEAIVSFEDDSEPSRVCGLAAPPPFDAGLKYASGMPVFQYHCQNSPIPNRISARREWPTTRFSPEEGWDTKTLDARGPLTFTSWQAEAQTAFTARTFREALHLFLADCCDNDLEVWCMRAHLSISWGDLERVLELPISELLDIPAMGRIPRVRKSVGKAANAPAVLRLFNETLDFLNGRLTANEGLAHRAARRRFDSSPE